ncbi:uncharacterized protein A1O9_12865 [Exophiala aquamarina CBS 119918]|uniref:Cytochrome P450 oxidoreductase n=1 Tax=Exophiala aquamarina CBS 119918 TaxID=1182545 RepID=A0A072NVL7_9EURO|nr:uncharacterized protein A1O9_12865 [Exophiala aquamarina CBS 119918]KEF51083.1 hypothetical protein A1O9_12865 [Exophiala aquamarina CBS 119918]
MDALLCLGLSATEVTGLRRYQGYEVAPTWQICLSLFILQYFSLKFYRIVVYPTCVSPLRRVPGPKDGHPLIGHAYKLFTASPTSLQVAWMRADPKATFIRYLSFRNRETLILNSPQAHREVLQTNCYAFVKPAFLKRVIGDMAGHGIMFTEGDAHKRGRRLLVGPFSHRNIKRLLPIFNFKAKEMVSVLSKIVGNEYQHDVEVTSWLNKTTLDIIGIAVLGYQLDALTSHSAFSDAYNTMFELTPVGNMIAAVNAIVPVRSWLPLKANFEFVQAKKTVRTLLRQHIRRRKQEILDVKHSLDTENSHLDLLSLILKEKSEGLAQWTEDEILGNVTISNFLQGHETTAGACAWALHALSLNGHMQKRLRDEINVSVLEDTDPTVEQIDGAPFLNNFVLEVLRFYSPAISTPREAARDVVICGQFLPKGTIIEIVPAILAMNPTVWGPTVDQFDPDRFDNLPQEARDPYAQQSFISGPRVCIGKSFALLEFRALLVHLVRNFEIQSVGNPVEYLRGSPSLRPAGGLHLKVTKI